MQIPEEIAEGAVVVALAPVAAAFQQSGQRRHSTLTWIEPEPQGADWPGRWIGV